MAQATATPVRSSGGELRIVLFGLKSAGKSSLLGALAQAAQTQEKYLKGQVIDRTDGRLAALHQRLFEDAPEQTEEDLVIYPLQFIPLTPTGPGPARNLVVVDCNGQSASDVLLMQQFDGNARRKALVRALSEADTIVLVVDGSDKPSQLERDFAQFANFLRLFEESRAGHGDVGGLPVYLVLTKCDLLAQPNDTGGAWLQRIEEKKNLVAQRFRKFLAKQADPSFGKISLHLWATAIHRPALADRPAKSMEPFGVADLFRQCLQSAMAYDAVRKQSHRRLQFTLVSVAALVAVMALLALSFYLGRPPEGFEKYLQKVEMNMPSTQTIERVENPDAAEKAAQLKKDMTDPNFARLSQEMQQKMQSYVKEVEQYEELKAAYGKVRVSPNFISTPEELNTAIENLDKFKLPAEFQKTNLGMMRDQLQQELKRLEDAVAKQKAWYEKQIEEAQPLLAVTATAFRPKEKEQEKREWLAKVDSLLTQTPPYPNDENLVRGAVGLQNKTVYLFEPIAQLRARHEKTKQILQKLRELVAF